MNVYDPAMSLDAVGQALGLTRERIRQIENGAVPRLRAALEDAANDTPDPMVSGRDGNRWIRPKPSAP